MTNSKTGLPNTSKAVSSNRIWCVKGEIEERTSLKTIKSQFDQPTLLCDFCDEFVSHIGGKCSLGAERILTIFFHYKEQLLFDQQV